MEVIANILGLMFVAVVGAIYLGVTLLSGPVYSRIESMKMAARCGCFDETCHKKGEPHERWPWDWRR